MIDPETERPINPDGHAATVWATAAAAAPPAPPPPPPEPPAPAESAAEPPPPARPRPPVPEGCSEELAESLLIAGEMIGDLFGSPGGAPAGSRDRSSHQAKEPMSRVLPPRHRCAPAAPILADSPDRMTFDATAGRSGRIDRAIGPILRRPGRPGPWRVPARNRDNRAGPFTDSIGPRRGGPCANGSGPGCPYSGLPMSCIQANADPPHPPFARGGVRALGREQAPPLAKGGWGGYALALECAQPGGKPLRIRFNPHKGRSGPVSWRSGGISRGQIRGRGRIMYTET